MTRINEYFDGNVKSIAFQTETLPATVGVMVPGEYVFDTSDREKVTVISGALTIQLTGEDSYTSYTEGQSFNVPANSSFNVKVTIDTSYLCLYG
ncbi:MAG TPA: pyrimidine/purine nucleoside phosphorylase [Gammaproteobacteria bacterium]|nr:pyrimidine/purine nucleoside phosphorylase [Gammaproteobacteria bacterium]